MAEICVDPAALKSNAKQIMTVSSAVQKAGDLAWRSASGAPSYDGQFGPKVRALGQTALARAKKQSASTNLLSESLNRRAAAFEAADSAAVKGISTSKSKSRLDKPGLLIFNNFIGTINSLVNNAKKILGLGDLGNNPTDYKIPTGFISESSEADAKYQNHIDELMNFMNTPEGRELAEAAMLAGLLFVMKDEKGNIIAQWGKAGGTQIPIVFGEMPFNTWGGFYSEDTHSITIKDDGKFNKGILLHEMQHAIDDRKSKSDEEYFKVYKDTSKEESEFFRQSRDEQLKQFEEAFEADITDGLKTEVNAYDIQSSYQGGLYEIVIGNLLNRNDGNYSWFEFSVVLEVLGYEETYEAQINTALDDFYGEHAYKADVSLDIHGNVRVDIEPARPLVIPDQILS